MKKNNNDREKLSGKKAKYQMLKQAEEKKGNKDQNSLLS